MKTRGHSSEFQERPGTTRETESSELLAVPSFEVRVIKRPEAARFILKYHYSKTVPTGDNIFFGCYVEDTLYAVANYGRLASRSKPSIVLKRDDATVANTLELRRLCRLGDRGAALFNTSDFLRKCHDILSLDYRYVLSYSDQQYSKFKVQFKRAQHKSGGIYKHAGFTWVGETPRERHVIDKDGNRFHRSRAYRRMLAHNVKLCGGEENIERKLTGKTGRADRVWPRKTSRRWATKKDGKFPEKKLWTLDQVRTWMGFEVEDREPKDKWLLDLG